MPISLGTANGSSSSPPRGGCEPAPHPLSSLCVPCSTSEMFSEAIISLLGWEEGVGGVCTLVRVDREPVDQRNPTTTTSNELLTW